MGSHLRKAIGIKPCCRSRQPAMAVLFYNKEMEKNMDNTQQPNKEQQNNRPAANYVRQQKGHSIIKHILLCCVGVGLFTIPYYSISPNHYWHA